MIKSSIKQNRQGITAATKMDFEPFLKFYLRKKSNATHRDAVKTYYGEDSLQLFDNILMLIRNYMVNNSKHEYTNISK